MKKKHGGERPGAGRHKNGYKTVNVQIKVRDIFADEVKKAAREKRKELEEKLKKLKK